MAKVVRFMFVYFTTHRNETPELLVLSLVWVTCSVQS